MTETYFITDTHFGHENILKFKRADGTPLRIFNSIEDHDEHIIQEWNKTVNPNDKVYHLGDVAMARRHIQTAARLNGRKVLIRGNHDIFKIKDYLGIFDDVRSYKIYPEHGFIFSHIPVHEGQLSGRFKINFHGHLHANLVTKAVEEEYYTGIGGPFTEIKQAPHFQYVNLCPEHRGYQPIPFSWCIDESKRRLGQSCEDEGCPHYNTPHSHPEEK